SRAGATGRRRPPSSPGRGTSATPPSGRAARASSCGWWSSRASPARSWRRSREPSPRRRSTTSSPTSRASGPRAPDRSEARLVVMAKHPVPGRVKTRLAAALGADAACALYRAFVLDLAERPAALTHGADVVLGPAADGGYYLIGLRGPAPGLFAGIAWGTAGVLEATLARAAAAGLAVHLLSPSFDVDQVADLSRLRALLARDDVSLPRTAGVLAGFAAVLDTLSRPGGNSG